MSKTEIQAIKYLIEAWRDSAEEHNHAGCVQDMEHHYTLKQCANDLEELLNNELNFFGEELEEDAEQF